MRCNAHMEDGITPTVAGSCQNCGNGVNRRHKKLCDSCSDTLKQCQVCRVPVADGADETPRQDGAQ